MPFLAQHKNGLVFFDESHFISEDMWRHNGWFSVGAAPAIFDQNIFEKQSLSLLLAISYNGKLSHFVHKHVRSQGVKENIFLMFLLHCHQIAPITNIFVLDNAQAHRSFEVEQAIQGMMEDGRLIVFQAKYSPDCNPIEYVFGVLKRRAKNTLQMPQDLMQRVEQLCQEMGNDDDDLCKNTIDKVFNF